MPTKTALLTVAVLAFTTVTAYGYETGSQYYEACWELSSQVKARHLSDPDPVPKSPEQEALWNSCAPLTFTALIEAGFAFANHNEAGNLLGFCPDRSSDMPNFLPSIYLVTVAEITRIGGPNLSDRVLPASRLIQRAWTTRWPRCAEKAREFIAPSPSPYGASPVFTRSISCSDRSGNTCCPAGYGRDAYTLLCRLVTKPD
jgi:hypothetical protein